MGTVYFYLESPLIVVVGLSPVTEKGHKRDMKRYGGVENANLFSNWISTSFAIAFRRSSPQRLTESWDGNNNFC